MLTNDEYFGIPEEDEGKITGELISYSLPGAMIATFFIGYIYDILGRRWTLFLSFATTSVLVFFVPYTSPVVWPNLFLIRMAISIATVPPICSPLLADYVQSDALGKGAALIGIGFILGEILSMGVLFNITKHMNAYDAFMVVAIIGFCCASMFLLIVKEPLLRAKEDTVSSEEAKEQGIHRMSTIGDNLQDMVQNDVSQISS